MPAAFFTYDADMVTCILGTIPMEGFAEDGMITIEYGSEVFTDVTGVDGQTTRSKTLNDTATVTIKLMQSSKTNDLLSALLNADRRAPNGAGVVPLYIRDRNGRSLHTAAYAWISEWPSVNYERGATSREWTIRCASMEMTIGGN